MILQWLASFFRWFKGTFMRYSWKTFSHNQPQNLQSQEVLMIFHSSGWWTRTFSPLQVQHLKVPRDGTREGITFDPVRISTDLRIFGEKVKWAICHTWPINPVISSNPVFVLKKLWQSEIPWVTPRFWMEPPSIAFGWSVPYFKLP